MKRKLTNQSCWLRTSLALLLLLLATGCGAGPGVGVARPAAPDTPAAPTTPAAMATPTPVPSQRGTGGTLRLLSWEAPTTLNPHLTSAGKDWEASRLVYEPLASFDEANNLVPFLAAEIPSTENGGVASDGTAVTWKLRRDVRWSDGEPFTAHDVKFTYDYITNPDVKAVSGNNYTNVAQIDVVDDYTIRITFREATPAWFLPFVGFWGWVLPRHIFEPHNGPGAELAPANTRPVGTGPYQVVSFEPQETLFLGNDLVETNKIVYEPNPHFRDPDKPYFSRIELRGGSTPGEAARLVLQEGTTDFASRLAPVHEELDMLAAAGQGDILTTFGSKVELLELNMTDPNRTTAAGERSSLEFAHPFFADLRVRQAFAHAIDRDAIAQLYGPLGRPTSNIWVAPSVYTSPNTPFYTYDLNRAKALLVRAGWIDRDGDGIREKDGRQLSVLLQTTPTDARVASLLIIQEALQEIGVDVELRYIDISIFYGGDPARNPNAAVRFQADMQEVDLFSVGPDPGAFMNIWTSDSIPQLSNDWRAGLNSSRWSNARYDDLHTQSTRELDEQQRSNLFIAMNDLLISDVALVPLVHVANVAVASKSLSGVTLTPWDANTWKIQDWRRISP